MDRDSRRFDSAVSTEPETERGGLRFDSKRYDSRGYLYIDAVVSTTGVLNYDPNDTGGVGAELVDSDTLNDPDYLNSLKNAPVTRRHPVDDKGKQTFLNAKNTSKYDKGIAVGDPVNFEEDGEIRTRIPLMIKDASTIQDVENRFLSQISLGYNRKLTPKVGEYKGKTHSTVQRSRIVNHISLEPQGRAGSKVGLRFDSKVFDSVSIPEINNNKLKEKKMGEVEIDGVKVEVAETSGAALINSKLKSNSTVISNLEAELATSKSRYDSLQVELTAEKEKVSRFDSVNHVQVAKERLKLENEGITILGKGLKTEAEKTALTTRFDSLNDTELRKEILTKIDSSVRFDGLEDKEIKVQYDTTMKYKNSDAARYDASAQHYANTLNIVSSISNDMGKPAGSKEIDSIANELAGN